MNRLTQFRRKLLPIFFIFSITFITAILMRIWDIWTSMVDLSAYANYPWETLYMGMELMLVITLFIVAYAITSVVFFESWSRRD